MKTAMLVTLLAVGCGTPPTDDRAATCSAAVARGVNVTLAKRKASALARSPDATLDAVAPRLEAKLTALCMEDRWPATVTTCLTTATDSIGRCKEGLTSEQRGRYARTTMEVMALLEPPADATK
jgi:hypothetical protein